MCKYIIILLILVSPPYAIKAQDLCNGSGLQELLLRQRIEMALNDFSLNLMRQVCPLSGNDSRYEILECHKVTSPCTLTDGSTVGDCHLMKISLGFSGQWCWGENTRTWFERTAIIVIHKDKIVDVPSDLIYDNEAFDKAARCMDMTFEWANGNYDKVAEELLSGLIQKTSPGRD